MQTEYDVIVVGGGGAGLAAATSAAEHGTDVLLLEKQPELGGTTGIAVGSLTANRTVHQRRAGIEDSLEAHEEDAGKFGPPEIQARNNAPLRLFGLEHSAATLDWLMGMGLAFHGPSPEPPNRVPRMHNVVPNAKAYIAVLQSRLLLSGGEIVCGARVEGLVRHDGRVVGVVARTGDRHATVHARGGVVLATGDYAGSPEMIGKHKGEQFAVVEGINPHSTGDGHRLAEEAGARLVNMDVTYGPEIRFVPPRRKPFSQLLPGSGPAARIMGRLLPLVPRWVIHLMVKRLLVTWQHPEDALLADGAILVNARGERFSNETASPDREIAIARQPEKVCYILLDWRLMERYSAWPHFISTAPEIAYAYVNDYLRMRPDVAVSSIMLEAVAARRGLMVQTLERTIDAFNRYVAGKAHDRFGRTGDVYPLGARPWCLLGPAKAYFTTTEGGAVVNQRLEVLDGSGRPIPGLYAAGQVGLGGQVLWGHGLHIGWAITSGRIAGRIAAGGEAG